MWASRQQEAKGSAPGPRPQGLFPCRGGLLVLHATGPYRTAATHCLLLTELIACLKDIIDEMAAAIGGKLEWKGEASATPRKQRKASATRLTCPALHLVCNTGEALTEARVLQTELAMRMDRLVTTDGLTGHGGAQCGSCSGAAQQVRTA